MRNSYTQTKEMHTGGGPDYVALAMCQMVDEEKVRAIRGLLQILFLMYVVSWDWQPSTVGS